MSNLSDVRIKKTPIESSDGLKHLYYDLNAFAELEEEFGSIEDALESLSKGSVKALISFLRAGILHESENLTRKEVGKIFCLSKIHSIGEVINMAITLSLPKGEDVKKKNQTQKALTG